MIIIGLSLVLIIFIMEGKAKALLLWLQEVTQNTRIDTITEIRNCRLIEQVLIQVEGFHFTAFSGSNEWKDNYNRLRDVYNQLDTYIRDTLKLVPPSTLNTMNLMQMAKGESQDGLQSLLLLVFIVCIRCPIKEDFIRCIMKLSEGVQTALMDIIQEWQSVEAEQRQDDSELNYYKQELERVKFHFQNLEHQNNSLRATLEEYAQRINKSQESVTRLQAQNEQLQFDLSQRSEQLRLRQQNFLDKYAEHNEDIVEQLKKKLIEQEQLYSSEMLRLKDTIYSLQGELGQLKKHNSDLLEMQQRRNLLQSREQHINCIPIQKHRLKLNQNLARLNQIQKKEIEYTMKIIKLQNQNSETKSNIKKLQQEMRKKENEFMINAEDSNKLKIELFTRVRDSLKKKLADYKSKENHEGSGGRIDFLDDE